MSRLVALLVLTGIASLTAQEPGQPAAFEVASIKPNDGGPGSSTMRTMPNGQFVATNVTLRSLIVSAYQVKDFQVTGGPPWLASDRFDINAKPPEGVQEVSLAMLRSLLEERFKLVVRREGREERVHALVLASKSGTLGPQLKVSALECGNAEAPQAGVEPSRSCALNTTVGPRRGRMFGRGQAMRDIATAIGKFETSRMVVDRTGLSGVFDFELRWTTTDLQVPGADDPPSLLTAIHEQLGLKLEQARGPVEFVVVESASQPSAD